MNTYTYSRKNTAKLFFLAVGIFLFGILFLTSCDEQQPVSGGNIPLDKHGAIDIKVSTKHYDGFDVLKVEKTVYDEAGNASQSKFFLDTMKSLSMVRDTLNTGRTFEDGDGNTQEIDTMVTHPKNYQIFITVK